MAHSKSMPGLPDTVFATQVYPPACCLLPHVTKAEHVLIACSTEAANTAQQGSGDLAAASATIQQLQDENMALRDTLQQMSSLGLPVELASDRGFHVMPPHSQQRCQHLNARHMSFGDSPSQPTNQFFLMSVGQQGPDRLSINEQQTQMVLASALLEVGVSGPQALFRAIDAVPITAHSAYQH